MDISVTEKFGNRLRVRVCGICLLDNAILMVNHHGLREGPFWAPPGGGVEFGVPAATNLEREFMEETGLEVRTARWMFATEFIQSPLHAVELFFAVDRIGGTLRTGYDPEMGPSMASRAMRASATASGQRLGQLIREVRFMAFDEVDALAPDAKHGAFRLVPRARNIGTLNGYHRI